MEIDIEDIKALDPGKVYVITLDSVLLEEGQHIAESLNKVGKEHNIKFIIFAKGFAELVSAPEGIEVNMTSLKAFQLMEKEMVAYLEKYFTEATKKIWFTDDKSCDYLMFEQAAVSTLNDVFLTNKGCGGKGTVVGLSGPGDWPKEVTEDQLMSIVRKWSR